MRNIWGKKGALISFVIIVVTGIAIAIVGPPKPKAKPLEAETIAIDSATLHSDTLDL